MSSNNWVSVIERLIATCKDGEDGYREAAMRVRDSVLKVFLEEQSAARGRFARELREEISRISSVASQGSRAGAVHRGWIGLQAILGRGDEAILSSVQQGERSALDAYDAALAAALPPQFEQIVRRQAVGVQQAYEQAVSWRQKPAA
jgi:uncharacterized protein (TIGR02284 family)